MSSQFRGQWTGHNNIDSFSIVNINQSEKALTGRVSVLETAARNNTEYSFWHWSTFNALIQDDNSIKGEVFLNSVYDFEGNQLTQEQIDAFTKNNGLEYPDKILIEGKLESTHELIINTHYFYPTIEDKKETFNLSKTSRTTSKTKPEHLTWEQFKSFTLEQSEDVIYRGQSKDWQLQTSYHRTGYADLVSYLTKEVEELEHYINAISPQPYNTFDNKSLGALLNLAQHHGYPTPLLDWSKSPYIAAFFALENSDFHKDNDKVSIFVFNEKKWSEKMGKRALFNAPNIMICALELPIINNPRALNQQALTMFSNVDDIESIIQTYETNEGDFLKRVTLDVSEAEKIMKDLRLMGISWRTLFPGLDGTCKQLKEKHFS